MNNGDSQKIKDFFKRDVTFDMDMVSEVLKFGPETLIGIDSISAEKLKENDIETIQDLADLSKDSPPKIEGILPKMLEKWIGIADVLIKAVNKELKQLKKILLLGLDNGGKSSILAALQNKFSTIQSLMPTKGVNREKLDFFGFPVISWDLGGQETYRKDYLDQPQVYFTDVDLVIYVIDIQDIGRIEESARYFTNLLDIFQDLGQFPPIQIALHKSDPDYRKSLEFQQNVKKAKDIFNPILEDFDEFSTEYYDTTIYQKDTIMTMFSAALKKISHTSEIIDNILREFAQKAKAKAASLISLDDLIFGSFEQKAKQEQLLNNSAFMLHTLSNFHKSQGYEREEKINLNFPSNGFTIRGERLFEYSPNNIPVYLWVLTENPELIDEYLDVFSEQLAPLIHMFL
jgi:GTPase SAR1 family protein